MPALRDTGRFYFEDTSRVRLKSPGLERFRPERNEAARAAAIVAAILAVLVGAMLVLWKVR